MIEASIAGDILVARSRTNDGERCRMAKHRGRPGAARGPAANWRPDGLCGETGATAPGGRARLVHWSRASAARQRAALALGACGLRWPGRDDPSRQPADRWDIT